MRISPASMNEGDSSPLFIILERDLWNFSSISPLLHDDDFGVLKLREKFQ